MDNFFRRINVICDEAFIPYYNKLIVSINSCPSGMDTQILRDEAEKIKTRINELKDIMTSLDAKIAQKYRL